MYEPKFEIPTEIKREIQEHEVLLSFVSDMDAAAFQEWMSDTGKEAFMLWLDTQKNMFGNY